MHRQSSFVRPRLAQELILILGIRLDKSIGLQTQSERLKGMTGADLTKTIGLPWNFGLAAQRGNVIVLPVGYIYFFFRLEAAVALRWSFSPGWEEETERVLHTLSASMEAYPSLRTTMYGNWYEVLSATIST